MNRTARLVVGSLLVVSLPLLAQAPLGSLTAWGGTVTSTPIPVPLPAGVAIERIAAGSLNTIAVATDGVTVYTWSGVGTGTSVSNTLPTPVMLSDTIYIQCVTSVAAGDGHFLALANAADLFAWGSNSSGQLGDGTTASRATPAKVIFPASVTSITQIAAGAIHSLAFTNDGLYAWGHNSQGDLGDGTTANRLLPVKVQLPASVTWITSLSAGFMDSFAVTDDGLYAWGYNFFGELGDGTTADKLTPVKIAFPSKSPFTNLWSVAAGRYHTLAVTDGGLFAWGQNINGTLGDGTRDNSAFPIAIKFPKGVSAVSAAAAGTFHSLAVTNNGLYAWGTDVAGQLGTTITKKRIIPTKVLGEDNAASAGAGEYFSVVLHY
jgi:alpha-tubulin suppressor-like RCC1 family protein